MDQAAPTTAEPTQPDPEPDRPVLFMPPYLAAVLQVVRVLLAHGRRFAETAPARARHTQFATAAAAFGTYKLEIILARVQRGILRAIALENYLLARAARGRDLVTVKRRTPGQPAHDTDPRQNNPSQAKPARPAREPKWRSQLDPDHPAAFRIPAFEEIEAQVRRRPIGRTIVEICNDLGVVPALCDGEFWSDIYNAIWWYGGSLGVMFERRKIREQAFEKEWNSRRDDWDYDWDWRDTRVERVRRALGCLIGEPQPPDPPDPPLATVLP